MAKARDYLIALPGIAVCSAIVTTIATTVVPGSISWAQHQRTPYVAR